MDSPSVEAREVAGEEPDIIQCVKSSSLGRDVAVPPNSLGHEVRMLPVAPPRRKRKNRPTSSTADVSDDVMLQFIYMM